MTRVIAVSNLKGGSAKTTTTAALGWELARLGKVVVLVDVDGQGHLAESFGIEAMALKKTIADLFLGTTSLRDVLIQIQDNPNLALIPSNLTLATLEPQLVYMVGRENKLKRIVQPLREGGQVDFVLIDCPPSVGIYTVNAFAAADEVLIPMTAEFFALTGVSMLLQQLDQVRLGLEHKITVTGVVPTRVTHTNNARDVIEQAKIKIPVPFFSSIPESVAVREATIAGQVVTEYAPSNPAALAYHQVALEVLNGKTES